MNYPLYVTRWGNVFCQTDVGGLWCGAKVRPAWFWWLKRVRLFLWLVWRRPDSDPACTRLDWDTAWSVSEVAVGLTGPLRVHRGRQAAKP